MKFISPFLLACLLLTACSVKPLQPRTEAFALPEAEISASKVYTRVHELSEENDNLSGVYPIVDALEAYTSRALLIHTAQKTLDVQYYIWRKDSTGMSLLYGLYLAAERGVRVRLLLDDFGSFGMDDWLAVLNEHPNIEVRLFNPLRNRKIRSLGFVTDFYKANRRMHNKSLTADQAMSIVGGRNIGDEYFAATDGILFADLDVLTIGPAAAAVSADFDRYWHSLSAYPVEQLLKQKMTINDLQLELEKVLNHPDASRYNKVIQNISFSRDYKKRDLPFEWVPVRLVSDDPAKGMGKSEESELLLSQLLPLLREGEISQLDWVSPYFVPTRNGAKYFNYLAQQGAQVRILTNSLAATDVAIVHSGYIKHRKKMLKAGVQLFEMKNDDIADLYGGDQKQKIFGSSGSSLHAKTFAINGRKVFVGSFNFDPRSARLNTELGFVIDSPSLAAELDNIFTEKLKNTAYRLQLNNNKIQWQDEALDRIYSRDPESSLFKRSIIRFLSWLPLDSIL